MIDTTTPWLAIAQWVFNGIAVMMWWWVKRRVERTDHLEATVQEQAKKLIDDRFAAISREMTNQVDSTSRDLTTRIEGISKDLSAAVNRLDAGEREFRELGQRDNNVRLEIRVAFDQVKDIIRNQCASREDMQLLQSKVDRLQNSVATIQGSQQ